MTSPLTPTLHYFHDPMCSWCWGYRPTWQALQSHLPDSVVVVYQLGGLAPDTDEAMPAEMRQHLEQIWQRIHLQLGTEFNFDFWRHCTPRRSTYPACRAVIAAQAQGQELEMILAIQQAYYLSALNPSNDDTLIALAESLALDIPQFIKELNAPQTQQKLIAQVELARRWQVPGFPSLVLEVAGEVVHLPIDYKDYRPPIDKINAVLAQTQD